MRCADETLSLKVEDLTVPALPYPKYSIQHLYLFPMYATRDEYRQATGEEPPAWNPYRAPKGWFDPKAKSSPSRRVVYELALATHPDTGAVLAGPDGKPLLDALVLDRDEAATVNIPPTDTGSTNVPGADQPQVPVPLRPLEPNEELFFDFGRSVAVKNLDLFPELEVGFTHQDRILLKAIATKLGVE
jgi:hypothetical protein